MKLTTRLHAWTSGYRRSPSASPADGFGPIAHGWALPAPLYERMGVAVLYSVIVAVSLGGLVFTVYVGYSAWH